MPQKRRSRPLVEYGLVGLYRFLSIGLYEYILVFEKCGWKIGLGFISEWIYQFDSHISYWSCGSNGDVQSENFECRPFSIQGDF